MKSKLIIGCMVSGFLSCERITDINQDIPFKEELVVSSFIAADDSLVAVSVTKTTPVFGTEQSTTPNTIENAEVNLNWGNQNYLLLYDPVEKDYRTIISGKMFKPGDHFALDVTHQSFHVTGETTLPPYADITSSLVFDSVPSLDGYTYKAHLTITSNLSTLSNILLYPILIHDDSSRYMMLNQGVEQMIQLKSGESKTLTFSGMFYSSLVLPVRLELNVVSCDEAYAKYHSKFNLYAFGSGGTPFSEPSIPYSNMSNKTGIFAAYAKSGVKNYFLK